MSISTIQPSFGFSTTRRMPAFSFHDLSSFSHFFSLPLSRAVMPPLPPLSLYSLSFSLSFPLLLLGFQFFPVLCSVFYLRASLLHLLKQIFFFLSLSHYSCYYFTLLFIFYFFFIIHELVTFILIIFYNIDSVLIFLYIPYKLKDFP